MKIATLEEGFLPLHLSSPYAGQFSDVLEYFFCSSISNETEGLLVV